VSELGGALPAAVTCPPKVVLSGQILSSTASSTTSAGPLANVQVHYEGNALASDPGASRGDVVTDSSGRYRLLVEPGSYRVVVKPSADKRLPWAARRVSVTWDTTLDITLSHPREVLGTVKVKNTDGTTTPVANAVVAIYRTQTSITPTPPPLLVYEALSNSLGQFKLVLPDAGN
jgi:hypothetical protein